MTRLLRRALLASGPVNLLGATIFAPPSFALRAAFGLPEAPPLYQWTLSLWVLAFGLAYVHAGWTGRVDRSLLALGGFGKAVFVVVLAGLAGRGEVPPATALSSLPDVLLAGVFLHGWATLRPLSGPLPPA